MTVFYCIKEIQQLRQKLNSDLAKSAFFNPTSTSWAQCCLSYEDHIPLLFLLIPVVTMINSLLSKNISDGMISIQKAKGGRRLINHLKLSYKGVVSKNVG